MPAFRRQPHTVQVVRPVESKNTNTGATSFNYAVPPAVKRAVKGFVSTQGGTLASSDEGGIVPFDATFFTKDTAIAVNDQVILAFSWLSGNFLVVGTEPKAGLRGGFDHNEVLLQKDGLR
jgi:hypothetical protein